MVAQLKSSSDKCSAPDSSSHRRKRVRISRACDTCRRRKERCDGHEPSCHRCAATGRPCSYYPSRRRGLPPGYVRGLEILLGLLLHSHAEAAGLIRSVIRGEAPYETGAGVAPSVASLLDTWRESAAFEQLLGALAGAESGEEDELYLQDLNHKWTSRFNALSRAQRPAGPVPGPDALSGPHLSLQESQPEEHPPVPCLSLSSTALPQITTAPVSPALPNDWPRLLNLYLADTHTWFPVVHKSTVFRSASIFSRSSLSDDAQGLDSGDIASLWAALALGSYQSDAPSPQRNSSIPPSTNLEHSESSPHLYVTARGLLFRDQPTFQTGHIHASLVLALRDIGREAWTDAWLLVCRATYIASRLGIIPSGDHDPMPVLDDAQKRLFLGCFVLDGIVASTLGNRPYLSRQDLQRVGDISVDGLEEWESWCLPSNLASGTRVTAEPGRLLSTFNALGGLVGLLKDLDRTSCIPESRDELKRDFMRWQPAMVSRQVSSTGSAGDASGSSGFEHLPPHVLHLHMLAVTLFVKLVAPHSGANPASSSSEATQCSASPALQSALESMGSMSRQTALTKLSRSLPTLKAVVRLLDRGRSSESGSLLPHGYVGHTSSQLSPQAQVPSAPLQSNSTQEIESAVPAPGAGSLLRTELGSANQQPPYPNAISTPGQSLTPTKGFSIHPSPIQTAKGLSGSRSRATLTSSGSQSPQTAAPSRLETAALGGADSGGATDQLNFLEMANWNAMSVDFMENLGVSGDGTDIDISSLFFATDESPG